MIGWYWLLKSLKQKSMLNKGDITIDISKHNGIIDFPKLKTDSKAIKGVIIKASEGATVADKKFFQNVKGCVNNNFLWSCYHFCTWNNEDEELDARTEAQFFLSLVRGCGFTPSLPLVVDVESNKPIPYTKQEMVAYVSTFVKELQNAGYDTAIYASPGFLQAYFPTDHPFKDVKLWVADYTAAINPVPGWTKIWMRQYTDKGSVEGINGFCDLNIVL